MKLPKHCSVPADKKTQSFLQWKCLGLTFYSKAARQLTMLTNTAADQRSHFPVSMATTHKQFTAGF